MLGLITVTDKLLTRCSVGAVAHQPCCDGYLQFNKTLVKWWLNCWPNLSQVSPHEVSFHQQHMASSISFRTDRSTHTSLPDKNTKVSMCSLCNNLRDPQSLYVPQTVTVITWLTVLIHLCNCVSPLPFKRITSTSVCVCMCVWEQPSPWGINQVMPHYTHTRRGTRTHTPPSFISSVISFLSQP